MADFNGEFPTIIGADAAFKGEISFDKALRIEGGFEGQIRSKGTLSIAEGAKVTADIEAANIKLEGECKGNVTATEKLQLMSTARMEGDLRVNRLEIADGAIFMGNVMVGQSNEGRRIGGSMDAHAAGLRDGNRMGPQPLRPRPQPQPQEVPESAAADPIAL
jgi:cytoskeletal protein CcmA (bactofilin family)